MILSKVIPAHLPAHATQPGKKMKSSVKKFYAALIQNWLIAGFHQPVPVFI
ncbi:MAG TPA: hypothetical protein VI731_02720 [Bacteroidia bacterium]|nr:hypothetical protein [Bacteroidia bacterium]